jgi:hypothetical protein
MEAWPTGLKARREGKSHVAERRYGLFAVLLGIGGEDSAFLGMPREANMGPRLMPEEGMPIRFKVRYRLRAATTHAAAILEALFFLKIHKLAHVFYMIFLGMMFGSGFDKFV